MDDQNDKCLWPRDDGTIGATVFILQEIIDKALSCDVNRLAVICHTKKWGFDLARKLAEVAKNRGIFSEIKGDTCVVHDCEVLFLSSQSVRYNSLRGQNIDYVWIDNSVSDPETFNAFRDYYMSSKNQNRKE